MSSHRLTAAQRQAVEHADGPAIVLAGPGTGKTSVIVHRVAHLVGARGIAPERVAAISFTNKAAGELRERIGDIVGGAKADGVFAGTFHSFGLRILRRFADLAGLGPEPRLLDSAQQRWMLRELIAEHGLFGRAIAGGLDAVLGDAGDAISGFRDAGLGPEPAQERLDALLADQSLEAGPRAELERLVDHVRLYARFDAECRRRGLLTVDDLITRPAELLRENASVRAICRHDHAHLVVDEFQDLNRGQIEFLAALAGPGEPDLCVVGDDDQAIYAFRGADQFAFRRFNEIWPTAPTLLLTENWRSGPEVIDVANTVIAESAFRFDAGKTVEVAAGRVCTPCPIEAVALENWADDGETIAAMILLDREQNPGRAWSDYAVIARSHGDLERVREALELERVPTVVSRGSAVRDDPGVQDLLAWISIVLEPELTWGVRRILTRPPFGAGPLAVGTAERAYRARASRLEGGRSMPPLVDWLAEEYARDPDLGPHVRRLAELAAAFRRSAHTEAADATIERIIAEAGLTNADLPGARDRTRRIEALVAVLRFVRERLDRLEQPRDLAAFMRYYADLDGREQGFAARVDDAVNGPEEGADGTGIGVRLLTAHGAKGLEFDTVFLPRVGQHGYPKTGGPPRFALPPALLGDTDSPPAMEEERRVFYVACTRAQRRLVLLASIPKKPGPNNFMGLLLSRGVATRTEAGDILARAAEAGLGRFDADDFERLELLRSPTRRDVLARARQRIRSEAALALDAADRTPHDPGGVEAVALRLEAAARRMAVVAALSAGTPPPTPDDRTRAFAQSLERELEAADAPAPGLVLRAPAAPLHLSFTTINAYCGCPRCFYVRHVMELPDAEGPKLRVGSVVHSVLETFCRQWREAETEGAEAPGLADVERAARGVLYRAVDEGEPVDAAELAQTLAQLRIYFESLHDPAAQVLEVERKHVMHYEHGGVKHRLTAKFDRIDRTADGIRIVDYKTGAASKKLLEPRPDDLQLGLYALAARHLFDDPELQGTAEYWVLATGERGVLRLADIDLGSIVATINSTFEGILGGRFDRGKVCYESCLILDGATE
jgi:DNA helicase-2/ATP-dependent DNA helicase PcrA